MFFVIDLDITRKLSTQIYKLLKIINRLGKFVYKIIILSYCIFFEATVNF